MSFTFNDFNDFKQLLVLHPEWQVELRQIIVGDDLSAVSAIVRDLAEDQRDAKHRLSSVEERLAGVEERLQRLEQMVEKLVEAQIQFSNRLSRIEDKVGQHSGWLLEMSYRDRAPAYFGRWLRRTKVVDFNDVIEQVESILTADELKELLNVDLIVRGRMKQGTESAEVWLAVEVSNVVDSADVERANLRASLLRRTGHPVIPVVAGTASTEGGKSLAKSTNTVLLANGAGQFWDEAVAAWIP